MNPRTVSRALHRQVVERATGRCEYCLFPEAASFLTFEIEHIIAQKHGGVTEAENLALACPFCNRNKGSDLGSIDPDSGVLTPFYNPRTQRWDEHFVLDGARIGAQSAKGRVTLRILQVNHPDRVAEREVLILAGLY